MTAVTYFIADCDLPFSIVNRQSYQDLLKLCNQQVGGMLVKRHSIAQHTRKIYYHYEQYLKKVYLDSCQSIAITQDAWTSPNNVPFMSLTGHFITNDWNLMNITLGIAEIQGENYYSLKKKKTYIFLFRFT